MLRKTSFLGALALLVAGFLPALAPASAAPLRSVAAETQPRDDDRYVNLQAGEQVRAIKPDVVTSANGKRVEIYSSAGDNEGGMDWRTVNAFAHLVNSVPKGKQSYTTLFNSLYDVRSISRVADPEVPGGTKLAVSVPGEVFSPTAAYLNQINQYKDTGDGDQFIHVLGAKESMDEAVAADSSLAKLVRAGRPDLSVGSGDAVDYFQCPGKGGCLSGRDNLMHSKYGAFEQARDSQNGIHDNVVWMTSSNLNGSSGSKKSNISIAIYDDKLAYDSIVTGIFDPSRRVAQGKTFSQAIAGTPYVDAIKVDPATGVITGMPTDSGITLIPSPRALSNAAEKTDTTDVEAAYLATRVKTPNKAGCKVYAVHSLFNATRGGVRDGLGDLAGQGCDVRVVLGDNAISDLVDGYFNMSSSLRDLVGRVEFANVHDKTLSYKDNSTATTFGGASNFTGTSLEYDELAFRADNLDVTNAVQQHSERIYQLGRGQTTWATPTKVTISPTTALTVKPGDPLQLSTRLTPENALVTKTEWSSDNPAVAVSPTGVVTAVGGAGSVANITVKVSAPPVSDSNQVTSAVSKTATAKVTVGGTSTADAGGQAAIAPTLTMDNYQSPGGKTNIVVTWGADGKDYSGVVKLQYYSGGWKTYTKYITTNDKGVGKLSVSFSSSKTWRAYGARLDKINGQAVPNSTTKAYSKWSINTVRTKTTTSTPRLYATSLVQSGAKIPFLVSWDRNGGVFRLQQRASGGSWKTHSTYRMEGTQEFIVVPVLNTKYWRIATSTGSTKVSNSVKVAAK